MSDQLSFPEHQARPAAARTDSPDQGLMPEAAAKEAAEAARPRHGDHDADTMMPAGDAASARRAGQVVQSDLVTLGFIAFDGNGAANTSSDLMVRHDFRHVFARDAYVGIDDADQSKTFLGRVVKGPFHIPHEVAAESAITRTTLLNPERTQFRPAYYASGTIEILGEVTADETVLPTSSRPRPYARTYLYPPDRLRRMLGLQGDLRMGTLLGYDEVAVHLDSREKGLLPRNIGIFGTVGSGKSNSTQVLMEEAVRQGWAVVIVDVEGEYIAMNQPCTDPRLCALLAERGEQPEGVRDFQVYVPNAGLTDHRAPKIFKIPISRIPDEVLSNILEFTEAQSRMWGLITERADTFAQQQRRPPSTWGSLANPASDDDRPSRYTLGGLVNGLREDQDGNIPLLRGLNIVSYDKAAAHTLRSKLYRLGQSDMLDWNRTARTPYLDVHDLLVPGRLSVLDVSETNDAARNIAISYLLQALFDVVCAVPKGDRLRGDIPRPPVLLVIEEVHTFVSRASASRMRAVLDQLQIISRRGRKRWMGLTLVSQQPGHVPDELFELANTRFVHQLKSSANLAPVQHSTGGVHEALWGTVPALAPGQCLMTGPTLHNPVFVQVRPARSQRLHTA